MNIRIALNNDDLRQKAEESKKIIGTVSGTVEQEAQRMDDAFRKVGMAIAGAFTVQQAVNFGRSILDVRKEIEGFEISFRTLLGNKEKADAMFQSLKEFAVKTPLQLKDLSSAAQTLLSFNINDAEIMPLLKAIGDISMGDSQKLNSLTLAFAQMSSAGKLMGQDLMQMINAGFNPLSVISEKTGKSIGQLKDEMSKGAISAEMVKQAFYDATSEGGKFNGMLESMSKGIAGSIANLQGHIDDMLNALGEQMQGTFVETVGVVDSMVQNYEKIGKVLLGLVSAYGAYRAALIATLAVEKAIALVDNIRLIMMFRKELGLLTAAQQAFNITAMKNPYIIAGAALVGVLTTIYMFTKGTNELDKKNEELNETLKEQDEKLKELRKDQDYLSSVHKDAANSIAGEISKVESLVSAIEDETASIGDRKLAIQQLQSIVPEYKASIDEEGNLYVKNKGAVDQYIESLNNLAIANALQSKREELTAQKLNAELDRRQAVIDAQKAQTAAEEEIAKATEDRNKLLEEAKTRSGMPASEYQLEANGTNVLVGLKEIDARIQAAENAKKVADNAVEMLDASIANAEKGLQEIDAYQKDNNIKPYKAPAATGGNVVDDKAVQEAERLKVAAQERQKALDEYRKTLKEQDKAAELDIRQNNLSLMEDSVAKEIDQIRLNYDKMIFENEKRRQDMYDELAKVKITEYIDQNPNARQSEINDYAKGLKITDADLTKEQRKQLEEYQKFAEDYQVKSNERVLSKMLSDVQTYQQQRLAVEEEFAKKREFLYQTDSNGNRSLKAGVTQGNVDELNLQEQNTLSAIDETFAQREAEYQVWCDKVANLSLEKLQQELEKAKSELAKMEASGGNIQKIATARAKVTKLESDVSKKNEKNKLSPNKRSIKEWEDLYQTLDTCSGSFESLGKEVGGVAGEIMSTAGQVASSTLSMINGIVTLVNSSSTAMETTSETASTAIQTVEKASVILAVISAAMQIATKIASLFNNDDQKQEEIENLQSRIDQLQWELDNVGITRYTTVEETYKRVNDLMRQTEAEILKTIEYSDYWFSKILAVKTAHKLVYEDQKILAENARKIADAYAQMEYSANKALGAAKFDEARSQLENLSKQQMLLTEQIYQEQDKKDVDEGFITDTKQKIAELGEEMLELINQLVEDIIGGSAEDIASELGDAFIEAFQEGEDAAQAWGDKVNEIVADILKRMLITQFLEKPMGDIFDKYKKQWFPNGAFVGMEQMRNSLTSFANDLNVLGEDFKTIWEELPDSVRQMLAPAAEQFQQEGSSGGFQAMSQDTGDELNGRFTAIQINSEVIREQALSMRQTLEETRNIALQSMGYLEDIEMNTRELFDMNDKLDKIVKNTQNL